MWSQSGTEMGVTNGYMILEITLICDKDTVVTSRGKKTKEITSLKQSRRA